MSRISRQALLTMVLPMCLHGHASATLTDYGNGLVYSSITNATWTKDANLFATMLSGNANLVTQIIAANDGVIHDTPSMYSNGTHVLSAARDFNLSANLPGELTWWGAQAFVGYLNSISYMGSKQWMLPNIPTAQQVQGHNVTGSQLGALYYTELGGVPGMLSSSGPFLNLANYAASSYAQMYHSIEDASVYHGAWGFTMGVTNSSYWTNGWQGDYAKGSIGLAWAVAAGNISAVPEPGALSLLLSGLGIIGFRQFRNNASTMRQAQRKAGRRNFCYLIDTGSEKSK